MTGKGEEVERVPNWWGNVVTGSGKANGMMPVLRVRLKRITIQTNLNFKIPRRYILQHSLREENAKKAECGAGNQNGLT